MCHTVSSVLVHKGRCSCHGNNRSHFVRMTLQIMLRVLISVGTKCRTLFKVITHQLLVDDGLTILYHVSLKKDHVILPVHCMYLCTWKSFYNGANVFVYTVLIYIYSTNSLPVCPYP